MGPFRSDRKLLGIDVYLVDPRSFIFGYFSGIIRVAVFFEGRNDYWTSTIYLFDEPSLYLWAESTGKSEDGGIQLQVGGVWNKDAG